MEAELDPGASDPLTDPKMGNTYLFGDTCCCRVISRTSSLDNISLVGGCRTLTLDISLRIGSVRSTNEFSGLHVRVTDVLSSQKDENHNTCREVT